MALNPVTREAYLKLLPIRQKDDLKLRKLKLMKETFTGFDEQERPLKLRYYQVQGVLHLLTMHRFLLGDDTGIGKCCTGDTLVRTSKGLIPIKNLNPGAHEPDTFAAMDDDVQVEIGSTRCKVSRFYYGGEKPTIKIRTRCGYEVEGSQIHPVMVRRNGTDQWVRLRDIQGGDYVAIDRSHGSAGIGEMREEPDLPHPGRGDPNERVHPLPSQMSPELARFLGYVVAESWFSRHDFFTISQHGGHNPDVHADIAHLVKELFGVDLRETADGFVLSSTQIIRFLRSIGSVPGVARDKEVPWSVLQGTRYSMREFLRGYVDAEGHANAGGIEVSSASETLLQQVQVMLLEFGIVSRRSPKHVEGYDHIYWRLYIQGDDVRRFMREIGLVSQRKAAALTSLMEKGSNPNLDVVPHAQTEVEDLRAEIYARSGRHGYTGPGISKRWGSAFYNTLGHIRAGRRNPTYQYLERVLEVAREVGISELNPAYSAVQNIIDRRWFYDPVEMSEDGWAEVFDIEVDDPRHAFVGNGIVNHNTIQAIAGLCYLWEKEPDTKAIVVTNKSPVGQWVEEFNKFTDGITVIRCDGNPKQRQKTYKEFLEAEGPTVMVMGYATVRGDFAHIQSWKDYFLVYDECQAFKNPKTQTHQCCKHMASQAKRVWGLTATMIKNNLSEGYGIYQVLLAGTDIQLFPGSLTAFLNEYYVMRLQKVGKGNRRIPLPVFPKKGSVDKFKQLVDPFYLGRPKHEVAKELPPLTIRVEKVGMTTAQQMKYQEALAGLLEQDQTGEIKETSPLTAITYCQQIANHPDLVDCEGDSKKLDKLMEILTTGEFAEENVIVYTRFRKMVDLLMPVLKKAKVKATRITGAETKKVKWKGKLVSERDKAMSQFQNPKDDTRVVCITDAASESINLQSAKVIIFYDTPWSGGNYLQTLGRMIRIGSIHDRVYALHLCAKGTIDDKIMGVLKQKMNLIEAVLGKRIKGEEDDEIKIDSRNDISDLFRQLQEDARKKLKRSR